MHSLLSMNMYVADCVTVSNYSGRDSNPRGLNCRWLFFRVPEHVSFIAWKARILWEVPWWLLCSGTLYKAVYLIAALGCPFARLFHNRGVPSYHLRTGKGKMLVCHVHAMNVYRGSRGIAPLILNIATRWQWVVNFMLRTALRLKWNNGRPTRWIGRWVGPGARLDCVK